MEIKVNKQKCTGCKICFDACPAGAIEIDNEGKANINEKLEEIEKLFFK
ncbi:MAG TPA: 4Fe-4S binding protein, partial [bacterium]|nr:4Fe-4S binding protein [bacterium]